MVGDNIRKIRKSRNMTQAELAEICHVRRQTVSSWEVNRTEPDMGTVELLAEALNCRKSDLIGESAPLAPGKVRLSYEDDQLLRAYHAADLVTREIILRILHIETIGKNEDYVS